MSIRLLMMALAINLPIAVRAENNYLVEHVDAIETSASLKLDDLLAQSVEKYPDYQLLIAMQEESNALSQRGNQWLAGAAQVYVNYKDDFAGSKTGAYEVDAGISVPLWNWGQRSTGLALADYSMQQLSAKARAIHLQVAGLLRTVLWEIKLAQQGLIFAQARFKFSGKLHATVKRRVELGDLARTDLLLVQSDLLQKRSELIQAEAETMHARKAYFYLTQSEIMPESIEESLNTQEEISEDHPDLAMMNVLIAQKKSQIEWIKSKSSGQTTLSIGGNTERAARGEQTQDSITFGVTVPFGGRAYRAPSIATANTAYVTAQVKKSHTFTRLSLELHEAEHDLEVEHANFAVAKEMENNAQATIKMASLSFDAGEINLMDYLRIQSQAQSAINQLAISKLKLQRNIALYNQALGVAP